MINSTSCSMLRPPAEVEQYFEREYGRRALLVPSARFGMYIMAKILFRPGDKVIISPITCNDVIFSLLAASVVPVFVDIDQNTGNIDVDSLADSTLSEGKGTITTNIYGTPDDSVRLQQRVRNHQHVLIEDCAQVLESYVDGQRVGTIGDVAIFSFAKYFIAQGGALTATDSGLLKEMESAIAAEIREMPRYENTLRTIDWTLERAGFNKLSIRLKKLLRAGKRVIGPCDSRADAADEEEVTHYAGTDLPSTSGPSLDAYDRFLQIDVKSYRTMLHSRWIKKLAACYREIDQVRDKRIEQNEKLIAACPLEYRRPDYHVQSCNLVVPFFTRDRDKLMCEVERRKGIPTWYIYDPPASEVFPESHTRDYQRRPEDTLKWASHVLPINSKHAKTYLKIIDEIKS